MKKIFAVFLVITTILISSVPLFSQDKQSTFSPLLTNYYSIKNALVKSDAASAAKGSNNFVTAIVGLDAKTLSAEEQTAFNDTQEKLLGFAKTVSANKDLEKQRAAFQGLSDNMITLVKATKFEGEIYVDYCPMKKASWLSGDKPIKNPYYGSSMLACGTIKETL